MQVSDTTVLAVKLIGCQLQKAGRLGVLSTKKLFEKLAVQGIAC